MRAVAPSQPGWVYILTNPALPGMVKVGLTSRTPTLRAAELAGASGVPLPFEVAWARAVYDCAFVEAAVHRMLDDRRVSGRREFFRVDVTTARQVIEAAAGAKLGRRYRPRQNRSPSRRKGRGGQGRDLTGFALLLSAACVVAVLVLLRPPLPGWLPVSVLQGFTALESVGRTAP